MRGDGMSLALRRFLFERYNGFGDKRIRNVTLDRAIKIDDQSNDDRHDAFCGIFVSVHDADRFTLSLTNNCPLNDGIVADVTTRGGQVRRESYPSLDVELSADDPVFVHGLAGSIRQLVAPGRRYATPNWKWVCPRTADSLDRFAHALCEYRQRFKKSSN
jgi:hypothetical protein